MTSFAFGKHTESKLSVDDSVPGLFEQEPIHNTSRGCGSVVVGGILFHSNIDSSPVKVRLEGYSLHISSEFIPTRYVCHYRGALHVH